MPRQKPPNGFNPRPPVECIPCEVICDPIGPTLKSGTLGTLTTAASPATALDPLAPTCDPCTQAIIDRLSALVACSCPGDRAVADSGELKVLAVGATTATLQIRAGTRDLILRNATDSDCRVTLPTGFVYMLCQETLILRNPYGENALQPFLSFSAKITFSGSVGSNARFAANYRVY